MIAVVAGSASASVEVSFWDRDGQPTVPADVAYKITGKEPGGVWQAVRDLTALTVTSSTVDISLTANDTTLLGDGPVERRRLCVFVDQVLQSSVDFDVVEAVTCDADLVL